MTFNPFVQQTRPTDTYQVLISLLVLHAASNNLAQICTSLRHINHIKSAPVCCELMKLLGYLRFTAQNSIGCNVNLRNHFQWGGGGGGGALWPESLDYPARL